MKFERCILKAVSRNEQYVSVYAKMFQKPLKDMGVRYKILKNLKLFKKILSFINALSLKARFEVMKRANGWRPFLYNLTMRCDELKKISPLTKIVWKWLNDLTNFNNSCPYNVNQRDANENIIYIVCNNFFSLFFFFFFLFIARY